MAPQTAAAARQRARHKTQLCLYVEDAALVALEERPEIFRGVALPDFGTRGRRENASPRTGRHCSCTCSHHRCADDELRLRRKQLLLHSFDFIDMISRVSVLVICYVFVVFTSRTTLSMYMFYISNGIFRFRFRILTSLSSSSRENDIKLKAYFSDILLPTPPIRNVHVHLIVPYRHQAGLLFG